MQEILQADVVKTVRADNIIIAYIWKITLLATSDLTI